MLLLTDVGSRCDPKVSGTQGPVMENSSKLAVLAYSGKFFMLLVIDFGSHCDPNVLGTSGSGYGELVKTRSSGLFWPGFYAVTHCFLVLVRSEHFENPGVWLLCTSSKLALLAYSSPFCMLILTDFGSSCDLNVSGTS